jgi:hypothetical protein
MKMTSRLLGFSLFVSMPLVVAPAQADDVESLAAGLKPLVISALPPVLYEKSTNWGHQELAPDGLRWRGLRAEIVRTPKNDGRWRKLRITTQDLPRTLEFKVSDFRAIDDEKQSFKIFVAFQTGIEYEHQHWDLGLRLWSGSIRAHAQLKVALDCESVLRVEQKGILPDITFRLRVVKAEVSYENLVVDHIAGVGGSAAKLIGEAMHSTLKRWKPSLERDLLAKADAAIVKAADTREVRLGLGGLVKKK